VTAQPFSFDPAAYLADARTFALRPDERESLPPLQPPQQRKPLPVKRKQPEPSLLVRRPSEWPTVVAPDDEVHSPPAGFNDGTWVRPTEPYPLPEGMKDPSQRTASFASRVYHTDPLAFAQWLATAGLIKQSKCCAGCGHAAPLAFMPPPEKDVLAPNVKDLDHIGYECDNSACPRYPRPGRGRKNFMSVRPGTIFAKSRESLLQWVTAMTCYDADLRTSR
jgi:hypothetical protein